MKLGSLRPKRTLTNFDTNLHSFSTSLRIYLSVIRCTNNATWWVGPDSYRDVIPLFAFLEFVIRQLAK